MNRKVLRNFLITWRDCTAFMIGPQPLPPTPNNQSERSIYFPPTNKNGEKVTWRDNTAFMIGPQPLPPTRTINQKEAYICFNQYECRNNIHVISQITWRDCTALMIGQQPLPSVPSNQSERSIYVPTNSN